MTTIHAAAPHSASDLWTTIVAAAVAALRPRAFGTITDDDMFDVFSEDDSP